MAISKLLQIVIPWTICDDTNLSVAPFHKSSCTMRQLFTGAFVGGRTTIGAFVITVTGAFVDGLSGVFVLATGVFVVTDATGDLVGAFVIRAVGAFVTTVEFKNGAKFHFGPLYLHPSFPYSVRPGQSSSSPALLGGPFPHWTSLYNGRPSLPGPFPKSSQTF